MITGALVGGALVLLGFGAGYYVAQLSAARLVVNPAAPSKDDEPTGVFAQSDASEALREQQTVGHDGMTQDAEFVPAGVWYGEE